jgi:DNA gyrase subunit A
VVKKTSLADYSRPRPSGIIAVDLDEGDCLVGRGAHRRQARRHAVLDEGKAVSSTRTTCGPMGRGARGVRGMNLAKGGKVIAMLRGRERDPERAHRHRERLRQAHPIVEYTRHGPRHAGDDRDPDPRSATARWFAATAGLPGDEIMLITSGGVLIRTRVNEIREMSRSSRA